MWYMVCMSQSQRNLEFSSQQNVLVNVVGKNGSLGQPMVVSARQSGLGGCRALPATGRSTHADSSVRPSDSTAPMLSAQPVAKMVS